MGSALASCLRDVHDYTEEVDMGMERRAGGLHKQSYSLRVRVYVETSACGKVGKCVLCVLFCVQVGIYEANIHRDSKC